VAAWARGLRAGATAVGGVPEVIDEDAGMLVAPGDVDGLAAAIGRLAGGLDRFDGAARARRARARYGMAAVGRVWDDVYDAVS
jgi:glycosyltransferase involved in cell wall biosynthesis